MIPNLTFIIAVYVTIRLGTIALRQYPQVEQHQVTRLIVAGLCGVAFVVVLLCTLDTFGLGLNIGSAFDSRGMK
ncbi:MAG TPA: hypothetical protein VGI39_05010 [Polyangiaceae bacterium]|jgi:hypothetical protein